MFPTPSGKGYDTFFVDKTINDKRKIEYHKDSYEYIHWDEIIKSEFDGRGKYITHTLFHGDLHIDDYINQLRSMTNNEKELYEVIPDKFKNYYLTGDI